MARFIAVVLVAIVYESLSSTFNCSNDGDCTNDIACDSGEACDVYCANYYVCQDFTIEGAENYDLYVNCTTFNGESGPCRNTEIYCPQNAICEIECGGDSQGCLYTKINATLSSELRLTGCQCEINDDDDCCGEMVVICPDSGDCIIEGDNGLNDLSLWIPNDDTTSFEQVQITDLGTDRDNYPIGYLLCDELTDWNDYYQDDDQCPIDPDNLEECMGECEISSGGDSDGPDCGDWVIISGNYVPPINDYCYSIVEDTNDMVSFTLECDDTNLDIMLYEGVDDCTGNGEYMSGNTADVSFSCGNSNSCDYATYTLENFNFNNGTEECDESLSSFKSKSALIVNECFDGVMFECDDEVIRVIGYDDNECQNVEQTISYQKDECFESEARFTEMDCEEGNNESNTQSCFISLAISLLLTLLFIDL